MKTKPDYYLGLDLGTTSVGWAVTDTSYNLLRAKGKDLWGIREFDEADTAAGRRTHRINRRRHQREIARIGLVKSYFDEELRKIDPHFIARLDNSKYYLEDKDEEVQYKSGIFNDTDYTDADYYAEYPTIFHLRQALLHNFNPDKHDARFVYLAILNLFKHRGHFLNSGLSDSEKTAGRKIENIYGELSRSLSELFNISLPADADCMEIEKILSDTHKSRTGKSEALCKLLNVDKKSENAKITQQIIKAICGLKFELKNIFADAADTGDNTKTSYSFKDSDYNEKTDEIAVIIGEDNFHILELMKEICDKGTLAAIMHGHDYLSDARVESYEKHKEDLKILKSVYKKYFSSDYNKMFNSKETGSYSRYVKSFNYHDKKNRRDCKKPKREDLYTEIKNKLKAVDTGDKDIAYILTEIENEAFLPKQLTFENGIIPNQVHLIEMKKILSNAEPHMPFLLEKDESGLTISERIIELFRFQIPYYIGPVTERSNKDGGNGWVVRKDSGKESGQILPWNFEVKIDVDKTSEKFIERLIRRCTYLNDEKVLPKASLEYEAFKVLNEINNLRIDGNRIDVSLKQDIYNELFKTGKKITRKKICEYLVNRGIITSDVQISGIDITVNNSLSSYGKFKGIFTDSAENDNVKAMTEEIIKLATIYGDSKELLRKRIEAAYGDSLTPEQIKRILGFKFKDWGNLSKEFLELKGYDKSKADGEEISLIRAMWDNNLNMMELINSDMFTFKESLQSRQNTAIKTLTEFKAEDLDDFYFSAPVKRMVWQTVLIIRELVNILGNEPKKIFIEMTRKPEDVKKRTQSRKQKFIELYKNIKDSDTDWKNEIEKADENGTIRSKKMYLYLTQMGKCMYTGRDISLNDLFNDNLYDIDHIYPRHFIKDDNIDNNLVLVCKEINNHKQDTYPLEPGIFSDCKDYWRMLKEGKFITDEKYNRLIGRNELTDEQKAGFIARQLVETSQGTKGIADIIKNLLPDTTIIYSKASTVSDFRQKYDLPKSRLLNEFHHANDAYLNIVVGNVYRVKFTDNPLNFIKNEYNNDMQKNHYNLDKMYNWDVIRNGETAWIAGNNGTIATVKNTLNKNTPLLTRYSFTGHGQIADETLYSKEVAGKKPENYIPLKTGDLRMHDMSKYGGFSSLTTAYFFLVEHRIKNKTVRTLETVPVVLKDIIETTPSKLEEYCEISLGLTDFSIRIRKIKLHSLIKVNGYFLYLTGKSGVQLSVSNATSLILDKEWTGYVKKLEKFSETQILDDMICTEKNIELYDILQEKYTNGIFGRRPNPIGEKLSTRNELFETLNLEEQSHVLYNVLKAASITGNNTDLSLINGNKNDGNMAPNKKISLNDSFYLINQSVTGLMEKVTDLLKV